MSHLSYQNGGKLLSTEKLTGGADSSGINGTSFKLIIESVCYYHVTYAFQSEAALCGCVHVKELLAQNRGDSNSNRIRTHNHLVDKRILTHEDMINGWVFF